MNRITTILIISLLAGPCMAAPTVIPPYTAAALSDPARGKDAESDATRHPGELAVFAELKPGDKVVDLIPGTGYWTRIFSRIVGPRGHVYAIWPNEYAKEDSDGLSATRALVKDPHYSNVSLLMQPAAHFEVPEKVDMVWTSQNYHDYPDKFMGSIAPKVLNDEVFKALKPGGLFVIVDHVAAAGSGMRDTDTLHRIDPQVVKAQVTASGFIFESESDVLHNGADNHTLKVFDPAIRGKTDQFSYRFRKPQ